MLLLWATIATPARAQSADEVFATAVAGLASDNFPDKQAAVTAISELHHPNGRAVLSTLLDGKLYFRNADNKVFITDGGEAQLALTDPLTLKAAGTGAPDDYTRITTNNGLRKALRSAVASFALSDPDADVRLEAVREMLRSIDEDGVALLRASVEKYAPSTASAARNSVVKDEATAGVNDADAERLVKEVCAARRSWKSGRDIEPLTMSPSYGVTTMTTRSGSRAPAFLRKIESTTEYTAVVTATPIARERTAKTVKSGVASSRRAASLRSVMVAA